MEEQVRAYQRIEGKKGRALAWEQAWTEWTEVHRENLGQFLMLGASKRLTKYKNQIEVNITEFFGTTTTPSRMK
jgi:hypothetical protein